MQCVLGQCAVWAVSAKDVLGQPIDLLANGLCRGSRQGPNSG